MEYLVHKLIDKKRIDNINKSILQDASSWQSGKKTAGIYAAEVKNNTQLDRESKVSIENSKLIIKDITSCAIIKSFTMPRKVHGVMFTRTSEGQGYGVHIDNPYMQTGRSDLSFTIFLNSPKEYVGGELCIQTMQEPQKIKLNEGEIIVYPSTSLHSVEKVTKGERIVCVGWIQSYVSNHEDRNSLFGLNAGAKGLLAKHGRSDELDLIFQSYSNLVRRLGD